MRKIVTLLGALLGSTSWAGRRQPTMPVPQVSGQKLVGKSLQIEMANGTTLQATSTGLMPLPAGTDKAVVDDAAARQRASQDPIAQGIVRLADQVLAAHERNQLERRRKSSRNRKQRAQQRKKKRGY